MKLLELLMAGINWDAVEKAQNELEKKGKYHIYRVGEIKSGESKNVRLLMTKENLNGMYYLRLVTYWIAGKPYTSYETVGEPCPLQDEYKEAKDASTTDKDLATLLKSKNFRISNSYLLCALLVEEELSKKGEILNVHIEKGEPVIFEVKRTVMQSIMAIVGDPKRRRKSPMSILDREKGTNLVISKTGADLDTKYMVTPDADNFDFSPAEYDDFYAEENRPDLLDHAKVTLKNKDTLRGIIRNYLYGEELPEEAEDTPPVKTNKKSKKGGKGILNKLNELDDE